MPGRQWVTPEDDIHSTSAARLVQQIRLGHTMRHAIDGKDERPFTVPCCDARAVEQAGRKGTMINFTIHGVGGDFSVTSNQAHDQLLAYLAAHRDLYWTDTFVQVMKYVKSQQAARRDAASK